MAALQSAPGVPDLDFEPAGGLSNLGSSPTNPSRPVTNRFSVSDDVIMSLGAHSLRIGVAITRVDLNQTWDQYPGGAWIFANLNGGIFPDSGLGGSLYGDPLLCVCGAGTGQLYHPERDELSLHHHPLLAPDLAESVHPGRLENQ